MKKPFRVLKAAPVVSLNFRSSYLKTSMVPSSDAQAMELDPWQKTNAFIFQPAKKKNTQDKFEQLPGLKHQCAL